MEWPSRLGRERRDVSATNCKSKQVSQDLSAPAQPLPALTEVPEGGAGAALGTEPCARAGLPGAHGPGAPSDPHELKEEA